MSVAYTAGTAEDRTCCFFCTAAAGRQAIAFPLMPKRPITGIGPLVHLVTRPTYGHKKGNVVELNL
jgi:hypothetical protein